MHDSSLITVALNNNNQISLCLIAHQLHSYREAYIVLCKDLENQGQGQPLTLNLAGVIKYTGP